MSDFTPMPDVTELVAGRDLDARVMAAVYKWRWFLSLDTGKFAFFPPRTSEWERFNFHPARWVKTEEWPAEAERYTDWHGASLKRVGHQLLPMPKPSTDEGDAIRALIDQPFQYAIQRGESKTARNHLVRLYASSTVHSQNANFCLAVCGAIWESTKKC